MGRYDVAMTTDDASLYQALLSRDARFDGRIFVGVSTTGIYCRPICRVRAPKASSCRFFDTAAAAEAHGFRPCLRCRPELAPGLSWVDSPDALAIAAARWLDRGEAGGLGDLAARMGVGERHLRRVFQAHFGVTLVSYLQTRRLLMAKRLLTDSRLPMAEVAAAAGFASVRRFNALFKQRYRLAPSELRQHRTNLNDELSFTLDYRPPYDWPAILTFFRARAMPGVESVGTDYYRRCVQIGESRGWIEVVQIPERSRLRLTLSSELKGCIPPLLAAVRRQFDVDCDPAAVAQTLGALVQRNPGLRLPGAIDAFEQAVRAILGQQVSVVAATTLAARLVARFGLPVVTPHASLQRVFPAAAVLAQAELSEFTALGILASRARTIQGLARAISQGTLRLDAHAPVQATLDALRALPGIGEWTAQYIALRCLSWPDAFPHTDLIISRAFPDLTPKALIAHAEQWRPWRGYATLHLWKNA